MAEATPRESVPGPGAADSNAVLFMCCHPATRPIAIRKSWPEISPGVNPSTRSLATRPDVVALRYAQIAQTIAAIDRRREAPARFSRRVISLAHRGSLPARLIIVRRRRVVDGAGPDLRRQLGVAAARGGIEHASPAARDASARVRRWPAPRDASLRRRAQDLAMGRVAQVVALATMTLQIGQGKRTSRDRQRLLRGIAAPGCPSPATTRATYSSSSSLDRRRRHSRSCARRGWRRAMVPESADASVPAVLPGRASTSAAIAAASSPAAPGATTTMPRVGLSAGSSATTRPIHDPAGHRRRAGLGQRGDAIDAQRTTRNRTAPRRAGRPAAHGARFRRLPPDVRVDAGKPRDDVEQRTRRDARAVEPDQRRREVRARRQSGAARVAPHAD